MPTPRTLSLPRPRSLAEVVTDGFIAQREYDAAFAARFRLSAPVEFARAVPESRRGAEDPAGTRRPADRENPPRTEVLARAEDPANPQGPARDGGAVLVRLRSRSGLTTVPGQTVAYLEGTQWRFTERFLAATGAAASDIPELTTRPQPGSAELIAAARTLGGNRPIVLNSRTAVLLDVSLPTQPPRAALATYLGQLPQTLDAHRAALAYAVFRGVPATGNGKMLTLADGTGIDFAVASALDVQSWNHPSQTPAANHPPLATQTSSSYAPETHASAASPRVALGFAGGRRLPDIIADAFYLSAEHQVLLAREFPNLSAVAAPDARTVVLSSSNGARLETRAELVARIRGDQWQWESPTVARFGVQEGVPLLTAPALGLATARELRLADVVKPILHRWTHVVARLGDDWAVLLVDAPSLRPTGLDPSLVRSALSTPLPAGVDRARAIAAYAALRRLPTDGHQILLP